MAPAGVPARALPAPDRREIEQRPARPQRRPERAPSRAARLSHRSLATRLIVFGVLVAVLGAGRVALSFAVVQKNLATDTVAAQVRTVQARNQQLAEQAATLSSALTVRNLAQKKYHLIVAPDVQFITVHARRAATGARP
jgi:cell division protein FtsB